MFKNIRLTIASLLTAFSLLAVPIAVPALVAAQDTGTCAAQGSNLDLSTTDCTGNTSTSDSTTKINSLVRTVINVFSIIVGVVSVIMIILAGLRYITSGGDSNNVSGAKNTIIYAIVGLIIVALAQFIVKFVLNKLGNGS